jgi:predicted glutamine amidotransferase
MCRLFGMSGGRDPVRATFWLLEAPDSLAQQSRREPDGTGLGAYDEHGRAIVSKQPIAAYEDQQFAQEAREVSSRTFIAHVRYASTGAVSPGNTHPFEQQNRLFAHNGVIEDLDALEQELGDARALVRGETDSERFFALITREIERDGDVGEAIVRAAGWVADNLPVYALNVILITDGELWALRYPDVHELYVLERAAVDETRAQACWVAGAWEAAALSPRSARVSGCAGGRSSARVTVARRSGSTCSSSPERSARHPGSSSIGSLATTTARRPASSPDRTRIEPRALAWSM